MTQQAGTAIVSPLVVARGLTRRFALRAGLFRQRREIVAVDNVDISIARGETVGVVGESGSGKSTLGRMLLWMLQPDAGSVAFDGKDLSGLSGVELRRLRRRMQLVFQDPYASLDPRRPVWCQIADPMLVHGLARGVEARRRAVDLLEQVGLLAAHADRLPHAFSGGQRQRIAIARALAAEPNFIVADEPVSALDVSVQAQLLNLLADLQERHSLAMLFVSHDLNVVRHISQRVLVMYFGHVVEAGATSEVLGYPLHPYTRELLAASPSLEAKPASMKTATPVSVVQSPLSRPSGCIFRTRCPKADAKCADSHPVLSPLAGRDHVVACHYAGQ